MAGVFLKNVEQMRQIQWSNSWLWDVKFLGQKDTEGLGPFTSWMPAVSITETIYTLETFQFNGGLWNNLEVPKGTSPFSLKMTLIDDVFLTIESWVSKWVNEEILKEDNSYVAFLEDAVRSVYIAKFTPKNHLVSLSAYKVYPKATMDYEGNSDSDKIVHDIEFVVAGTMWRHHYNTAASLSLLKTDYSSVPVLEQMNDIALRTFNARR